MFEDYIENVLKDKKIAYKAQYSKHYLIKTEEKTNKPDLFNTHMDFVLFKDDKALILDAKWKILDVNAKDRTLGVSQGDLYQLFTYAKMIRSSEKGEKAVSLALLYPQTSEFCQTVKWKYFDDTPIYCIPVNVLEPENNSQLFESIADVLN